MHTKTVPMALFDRRFWLTFSLIVAVLFCAATLPAFATTSAGGDPNGILTDGSRRNP